MKKALRSICNFLLGVLLLVVSLVLSAILWPWGFVEMLIQLFWNKRFWKGLNMLGELILLLAVIVDVTGNVLMQVPFNRILITNEGYRFGSRFDTISYVLGHALVNDNLTPIGEKLCKILDFLDKDHCAKTYYQRKVYNK